MRGSLSVHGPIPSMRIGVIITGLSRPCNPRPNCRRPRRRSRRARVQPFRRPRTPSSPPDGGGAERKDTSKPRYDRVHNRAQSGVGNPSATTCGMVPARPAGHGPRQDRQPVQYRLLLLLRVPGSGYHMAPSAQAHAPRRGGGCLRAADRTGRTPGDGVRDRSPWRRAVATGIRRARYTATRSAGSFVS